MKSKHKSSYLTQEHIYQYYGFLLNQVYNKRVCQDGTDDVAIAYRNNLGQNNIDFAKRAIDFIRTCGTYHIIIGDFTKFFDNLDHGYLKRMLCSLLGVSKLPPDYYAIYKNITLYSQWEMESILKLNDLKNTRADYKELNKKERALSPEQFKKHVKSNIIQPTKDKKYGIPQGSAISAVFANIYMLDFDKKVNDLVQSANGLYMRYSDDFIIILPTQEETKFIEQYRQISSLINKMQLILQPDKTKIYFYNHSSLLNINSHINEHIQDDSHILNYLGFSFDGKVVSIRDKIITKYYYRMHRKVNSIIKSKGVTKKGNKITCKNLYNQYSIKGAYSQNGNFLTYINRAKNVFGENEAIDRSTKNHMQKIGKRINQINK